MLENMTKTKRLTTRFRVREKKKKKRLELLRPQRSRVGIPKILTIFFRNALVEEEKLDVY